MTTQDMPAEEGSAFQKVIRCKMSNAAGEQSVRYVALEYFLLWEYMMQQRHGFSFEEYSLCMWIPAEEYASKPELYAHSGEVEPVDRINIHIYDDQFHYTYCASRFVREEESEDFNARVMSHVPERLRDSNRLATEVMPGYCIVKDKTADRERYVLGLYGGLHDIY